MVSVVDVLKVMCSSINNNFCFHWCAIFRPSVENMRDGLMKELTDVKRSLADATFEKEKYSSSNKELREHVKRVEGQKREQGRSLEEALNKITGIMVHVVPILTYPQILASLNFTRRKIRRQIYSLTWKLLSFKSYGALLFLMRLTRDVLSRGSDFPIYFSYSHRLFTSDADILLERFVISDHFQLSMRHVETWRTSDRDSRLSSGSWIETWSSPNSKLEERERSWPKLKIWSTRRYQTKGSCKLESPHCKKRETGRNIRLISCRNRYYIFCCYDRWW